ncbi:hypothetical protein [Persephonella sp.]
MRVIRIDLKLLKIGIALILTFYVSKFIGETIFFYNTPYIDREFITFAIERVILRKPGVSLRQYKKLRTPILIREKKLSKDVIDKLFQEANTMIAPGIYAKDKKGKGVVIIKLSEVK